MSASGRVVLFGATGYTGELVARAMAERGMKPVLAGRRGDALARLAGELGGGFETAIADVAKPETVRALVSDGDVLVTTVGPFARWGEAALDAALDAGAHYVDSTGEPAFIRRVFERAGPEAEAKGRILITACGYDWVPGNLAGGLVLDEAGDRALGVRIGYFATGAGLGGQSGGTRASSMGALLNPGHAFRNGRIVTERGAAHLHTFQIGSKQRQGISVGSSEAFSLPRVHPGLREVDVYLGWFGGASRAMQVGSVVISGITKVPGVRAGLQAAASRFVKTSTGGPDADERAAGGSLFVAEALSGSGEVLAKVVLEGASGYTFTAEMMAWAAERLGTGEGRGAGALGPVEAFGLERLREGVAESGISVSEPSPATP
jgi:short subunit dehydrogenase-like uncharacterized protein